MKNTRNYFALLLLSLGLMSCQNQPSVTQAKEATVSEQVASPIIELPADTHDCGNCGMPSKEFPKWNIEWTQQGKLRYFCSPRCMFVHINSASSLVMPKDTLMAVDYYTQKRIDAHNAYYVMGSNIIGPMGHDLVPLGDVKAAEDFKKDHQGKIILQFKAVDNALLQGMSE